MKKSTYLVGFLITGLVFTLTGCLQDDTPCRNEEPTTLTWNVDTRIVPYRKDGLDTLVYLSDKGDTATLYGEGAKTKFETITRQSNGAAPCVTNEVNNYETKTYVFNGSNPWLRDLVIGFNVIAYTNLAAKSSSSTIGFSSSNYLTDTLKYDTTITINGENFIGKKLSSSGLTSAGSTTAVFHYRWGLLQFDVSGRRWTLRM